MKSASFSPLAVTLLLASAVALFSLSILLHAYDNDPTSTGGRPRPSSYSLSAIGHAGFYDVLRRLGYPVSRSTGNTLAMVGQRGTLIVAEPDLSRFSGVDAMTLMTAPRVLLVLPKWRGTQDPGRPAWISKADLADISRAEWTLDLVTMEGNVVRAPWPAEWTTNRLDHTPARPAGSDTVQLIRSREIWPIISADDGILLGAVEDEDNVIWVLSDPDILSNHGMGAGDNAALCADMVRGLHFPAKDSPGGPIVFDETLHGYLQAQGSPVKLLFRFPFVVVTVLAAMAAGLLALAATGRFGAPLPPAPALDFGKRKLMDNSARLLDYAGHHGVTLTRYIRLTVRSTALALHAPHGLDEGAVMAWLDRVGKARGVTASCADIVRAASDLNPGDTRNLARLMECARNIYRWKGEIIHASRARGQHRQQHQG